MFFQTAGYKCVPISAVLVLQNKEGELYFLVKADLALVVEHRSKIERLFSVTLLLDVQLLANQSHWIGVKGDSRDRLNAKVFFNVFILTCTNGQISVIFKSPA